MFRIPFIAIFLLMALRLADLRRAEAIDPDTQITVGALMPLTGSYSPYGTLLMRGLELGGEGSLKWLIEDVGTMNAKDAVTASHKLLRDDKIKLIVNLGVDDAEWIASIFNQKKVPLVIAWDSNIRMENLGEYVFSLGYDNSTGATKAAIFLKNIRKVQNVAILAEESAYNHSAIDVFKLHAQQIGLKVVFEQWHNLGETDFRASLLKIRQKQSESIYFMPSLPESFDAGTRQMKELQFNLPIVSNELFISDAQTQRTRAALNTCGSWIPEQDGPNIRARYLEKYKEEPWNIGPLIVGMQAATFLRNLIKPTMTRDQVHYALKIALGPERRLKKQMAIWCWENGNLLERLS